MQKDEFSRTIQVSEIGRDGLKISVSADKDERDLLARRFCVSEIKKLDADIYLVRRASRDESVYVDVHFFADLVQNCVVSLRPIEKNITNRFSVVFASEADGVPGSESFTIEDSDPPEVFSEGQLEIGGLVAEYLALALDPYPRHPDAVLPEFVESRANGTNPGRGRAEKPLKDLCKILKKKEVK